ncbi:MAG TPA: C1 family peptidase [Bacteroidota bacterium]|nr:C1 family peptidase [Bacteroidota bacterium]
MRRIVHILVFTMIAISPILRVAAQPEHRDRGKFVEPKNEFLDSARKALDAFSKKDIPPKKRYIVDFSGINAPASPADFTSYWHNKPVSQALSGMCWCFSTTSFLESEIYRLSKREIKLSELYTVYWEYVEKARRFVTERGNSVFGEGSEANAVTRIWKKYGIVPEESYTGLKNGQPFHDHGKLFEEMSAYLQSVKSQNVWNEDEVTATIKSILNHYIGEPPKSVEVDGKQLTPHEYLQKVVKLNLDDYVAVISLLEKPYNTYVEYEVGDNWWHSAEYLNVPLDAYTNAVKKAIRNGYTMAIFGDVSEAGIDGHAGLAVIPSFDIPANAIDEYAREFRFSNGTTGDDHGIHLVGYTQKDGLDWYLIKDSGSGSRNNNHPGYYFFREDFVKLKMLGFMIHKDAIRDLMNVSSK